MIKIFLEREELNIDAVCERYHFPKEQKELFEAVFRASFSLVHAEYQKELRAENEMWVAVTLGQAYDDLQNLYMENEALLEAYMMDVLGMEFLKLCYSHIEQELDGLWVAAYHFPGDHDDIEMQKAIIKKLQPNIHCNDDYQLLPHQSITYVAELTKEKQKACHFSCDGCKNVDCPNRYATVKKRPQKKEPSQQIEKASLYSYGVRTVLHKRSE